MNTQQFVNRHISLNEADKVEMLNKIGVSSIDELISQTIPHSIRLQKELELAEPLLNMRCFCILKIWQLKM